MCMCGVYPDTEPSCGPSIPPILFGQSLSQLGSSPDSVDMPFFSGRPVEVS